MSGNKGIGVARPADLSVTGRSPATPRAILSAMAGNFLEFYDFLTYAFFASYIGKAFFPATNPLTSILLSFATYGIGFLMRPVGAIVVGTIGDIKGRKPALLLTIGLMAGGTVMTGIVPPYRVIGILAPILVVIGRSMQGFSAGGEWGGAASFLVEYAPPGKRGLFGSFHQISVNAGLGAGAFFGVGLSHVLSPDQLSEWGWRIPFLLGGLIAPIGLYLRSNVPDTPVFEKSLQAPARRVPFLRLLSGNWRGVLTGGGIGLIWTVSGYGYQIYMPTFLTRELGFSFGDSLLLTGIALGMSMVLIPIVGALSDRIGRKPLMLAGAAGFALATYPLFLALVHYPTFSTALFVVMTGNAIYALYSSPAPAAMCELFPTGVRMAGMSIGYNIIVTIFGGFAPVIATTLISLTGSPMAPSLYVVCAAVVSFLTVLTIRDRWRLELTS